MLPRIERQAVRLHREWKKRASSQVTGTTLEFYNRTGSFYPPGAPELAGLELACKTLKVFYAETFPCKADKNL